MKDDVSVSGPITVKSDAKERVALDLAKEISVKDKSGAEKDRTYWLTLYRQCLKATTGWKLEDILKED